MYFHIARRVEAEPGQSQCRALDVTAGPLKIVFPVSLFQQTLVPRYRVVNGEETASVG
jgi:hypothetical protein